MGKSKSSKKPTSKESASVASFLSPLAEPMLEGDGLEKGLKLLKQASKLEQEQKGKKGLIKPLRRGVFEVTKAIKKGETGLVFIASDIFPEDVFAHLPAYCDEKNIPYIFLGTRKTLGACALSKRMSSVLMVVTPKGQEHLADLEEGYDKCQKAMKKAFKI